MMATAAKLGTPNDTPLTRWPVKPSQMYKGGCRAVAVYNRKGGVGKTTVADNLAVRAADGQLGAWAISNEKCVLLADIDSQQNTSCAFLKMERISGEDYYLPPIHPQYNPKDPAQIAANWNGRSTTGAIYYGTPTYYYPTMQDGYPELFEYLFVLPADGNLLDYLKGLNLDANMTLASQVNQRVRDFMSGGSDPIDEYCNLAIFDCPPGKTMLTVPLLRAMTDFIIPVELETDSMEGLDQVLTLIAKECMYRDSLPTITIVPNKVMKYGKSYLGMHAGYLEILHSPDKRFAHEAITLIPELKDRIQISPPLIERAAFKKENNPDPTAMLKYTGAAEADMRELCDFLATRVFQADI